MTGINPTAAGNVNDLMPGSIPDSMSDSMSEVIGAWIIYIQYGMPRSTANSAQWRELLSLALNTGRDKEDERFRIIMDWTWDTVLPVLQPLADERGFGEVWASMCAKRTAGSASGTEAALANRTGRFAQAARVARAAAHSAAEPDATAGTWFVKTARAAAVAVVVGETWSAGLTQWKNTWTTLDPVGLLQRLVEHQAGPERRTKATGKETKWKESS